MKYAYAYISVSHWLQNSSFKWLEKCYPKDKFDKSTRRHNTTAPCSIYFSMTAFIDTMKFLLSNQNINNLMFINFHISLITNRFFRSFDRHSNRKNGWLTCRKKLNELARISLSPLLFSSFSLFLSIWSFWSLEKIFYPH